MATFDTLYTGENSAVRLPDLDKLIRSQERMGEMVIAGEERILQRKEKDSAFVLEQMKVNPVLLISDKLRTEQAIAIERYNNIAAELLRKGDGILNTADKLVLQREKDALTAMQQGLMADQQRFQQEYALMQKDQGMFYDEQEFTKAMGQFYETGEYPPTALIAKPKDPFALLSGLKPMTEQRVPQTGGTGYDVTSRMTEDQARLAIRNTMLRDEGSMRGFLKVFEQLPESEQLAVLDTDGSGAIDPTERQAVRSEMDINNPIVQWAESYKPFLDAAMNFKTVPRTATQERGKTPVKTTFKTNAPVSADNNKNTQFAEVNTSVPQGAWTFNSWVDLKKSTTGSLTVNEWYDPADKTKTRKTGVNNVVLDLIGYSPSDDKIVARVKSSDINSDLFEDDIIILDGARYDNILRREMGLYREGFKSFKPSTGFAADAESTSSGVKWK